MPLTPEQIGKLLQIIRDGSTAVAIATTGHVVSKDELDRLRAEGYLTEEGGEDLILDSFAFGQLMQQQERAKGMSYEEFKNYLKRHPVALSAQEKHAVEVAKRRAGTYVVGLGNRFNQQTGEILINADAELAARTRAQIRDATAVAIERRNTVKQLKTTFGHMTGDWKRDWDRIAATETHLAQQEGFLHSVTEKYGDDELLAKIPEGDACPHCRKHYLGADGRPKARPAKWWHDQGASNAGRKTAEWKPVLGAMHPWCRCALVRVPAGWAFDEKWDLLPAEDLTKAHQLYLGPRGGKWADPKHTVHWEPETAHAPAAAPEPVPPPVPIRSSKLRAISPAEAREIALKAAHEADPKAWALPTGARVSDPWEPPPIKPTAKWVHPDYGEGEGAAPWQREPNWHPDFDKYDYVLVNSSAGKDSQAMLTHVVAQADAAGYPRSKVVVVHADMGRAEWEGTQELAEQQAKHYGLRFEVVKRERNDLLADIEERYWAQVQRYMDTGTLAGAGVKTWQDLSSQSVAQVEKIIGAGGLGRWSPTERAEKLVAKAKKALTGKSKRDSARAKKAGVPVGDLSVEFGAIIPWPSADARFCTSDHKRAAVQVLTTSLADKLRDETGQKQVKVLNALGIRAQEGDARESMSAFSRDKQSSAVKVVDRWFPIHLWPEKRVWETIRDSGLPHHVAYDLGMHRLSCAFCVFAKKDDLMIAAKHNPTLFAEYVALEKKMSDTNPTGPAHFTEKLSLQDLFQEILLKRQEGYELNELAEWVKKSFGIELPLSLIKAVTEPSEAEGPVMVILAAALERLRRLGQDIKTLTIEWKTKGACFHLDTPTYSHHVSYQSYPAAWNQSLFAAQFADTMNLTLEEHNAPPAQADLESALTKADRLPGGRADRKRPTDFPADILREGTDHELEHTHSRALAREIAMDHLTEDPDYYVKLGKVEKAGHVLLLGGQPLLKAEQLGMFGMKPKVIRGSWQAIPHTIHPGGQRRRLAGKWEYRYPQPSGGYAPTPHQEELKLPQGVEREFTLPPRPGSPGVPKPASFNEVVAGSVAWAAAARQAGKDIVAHAATVGKPIELAHGSDRAVTIWRNPHGTWRLSYFDKIGASSHEDGEDPVALATEAVRMGYTKFEPGAVDRVVDLEAAAEATARREAWDLDAAARRKAMIREPAKPPKPSTERGMLSSPPKLPTTGEIVLDWKRTEAGKDWTLDAFKVAVEPPEARNPEGQVIGEDAFVKATEPLGMKLQKVVDLVVHHFGVKPDVPTQVRFEPLTLLGGYFDKKKGITLSLDHAAGFHRGVGEALRNAVRVLLHESMHAASNDNLYEPSDWPWRPRAALEEATTEILAQHLTNDFVRPLGAFITDPTPHQLFSMHEGFAGMVAQVDRYDSTSYLSYVTKFAGMAMVVDGLTELKTPMSPVEISNHIAGRAWEVKVKVENAEASDRYNSLADFYLDRVNAKQAITQSVPPRALERDSLEDRLNGVRLDVSKMLGNFMTGSGPFEDTASRKLFNRPPDMWALKKALEAAVQAGGVTDWKYYVRKKAKKPRRLPAAQEATA